MRVDRLLSILLIISNKGHVTGKELAEHFEVSLRTIYRDIEKIGQSGVPIVSTGGKGGGYYLMEDYNLDNLFLNKGEMQTFMTVIKNINYLFGENEKFNNIVLKFKSSYDKESMEQDKLSINMSHFSMEEELKEYLFTINNAIENSKLLIFDYINRRIECSERVVEPIQIAFSHGQWYLTAYCRTRNDLRKFKLVRIRKLRIGDSFIKKDFTIEELQKIFEKGYVQRSIKVKLKFTNKIGAQLTEYFLKETIMEAEDGGFIVEDLYPHEEGLLKFILSFGIECEVIEPKYLREEVKQYLDKILVKYKE